LALPENIFSSLLIDSPENPLNAITKGLISYVVHLDRGRRLA
jgi:hypothetical protein